MPLLKDGTLILFNTIDRKLRHQDYDYVTALAKDYGIYATGVGIEDKLKRFNGGETEQLFDQRKILTMVNTVDILYSCVKPLFKVGRTPAAKNMIWTGKDAKQSEQNKKNLLKIGSKFWGDDSVESYLTKRMAQVDSTDPNSFVVVEFKEKVRKDKPQTKANPYPFEVNSAEAINYWYDNNELQWLIALNDWTMLDPDGKLVAAEKYYIYLENENVTATQIHTKTILKYRELNPTLQVITIKDFDTITLDPKKEYLFSTNEEQEDNKRWFHIKVYEHKIGHVPAKRFGTVTDTVTRGRTCIPVIHPAKWCFEDSIQTMSEFGITKRLHTFPQKWQYLPKCPACFKGMLDDGKTMCTSCKGSGTITHESSQDIVGIPLPDEMKDIINIDLLSTYKGPPIDLVKFQKEYGMVELKSYAQSAVYNGGMYGTNKIIKTATENEIDLDAVYDTLKDYADNWSKMYVFIFETISVIREMGEVDVTHSFPNDFKMESFGMLLDYYAKASKSGVPSHVIKALTNRINNKIYVDDPRSLMIIEVKDRFFPFPGKTETEIQFIIANGKTTKRIETLYAHFDLLFQEIEQEQKESNFDFYLLEQAKQRALINQKLDTLLAEIKKQDDDAMAQAFTLANTGADV